MICLIGDMWIICLIGDIWMRYMDTGDIWMICLIEEKLTKRTFFFD